MKNNILNIFSSNIKIKVTGKNVNNFIKRLIKNNINIIKIFPCSYKEIDIIIDYNDYDNIIKYKSIYDIKIIRYYGLLNIFRLIKKNIFIISFFIFSIILIYVLSNIIFDIEIIHSNSNIVNLVQSELNNYGIKKYSFVKNYDEIEKIEDKILDNNKDNLEWIEIIRNGTKFIVRVEERIIKSNNTSNVKYDVIAGKNGLIKEIYAYNGEKIKNINTYVNKGDIIISSFVTMPDNTKELVGASGKVIGEVWYNVDVEYPFYYNEIKYTGNKKKVLVFNFLGRRISLFDFNKYKKFNKDTKCIFNNLFIPISLDYEYQYETDVISNIYTYDEARDKATATAKEKLISKYNNIININDVIILYENNNNSKIKLNLFISCDEDITLYKESIIDE